MDPAVQTSRTRSMLPMRLRLLGLQDLQRSTLLFASRVQSKMIPLRVSAGQADALAPFHGKTIEVTARVHYDDGLDIVDGELVDWSPLDERTSPIDALRAIFSASNP